MEWPTNFHYSPMDESLYGLLSSSPLESDAQTTMWTAEENDLFENALAEFSPSSPAFLESVATRVPWKSMEDVKSHYRALLDDIDLIETGKVPLPRYPDDKQDDQVNDQSKVDEGSTSNDPKQKSQRGRGVPWTEDEHQRFLMGLNKYGKGEWSRISKAYVVTKTPTQVASHAQKYFHRQTCPTPPDRRRPSIHDIQTISPTAFTPVPPQASTLPTAADPPLPNFPSDGSMIQPLPQPPLNHAMTNSGGAYDPNAMFYTTMNNNSNSAMINNMNPTMMNFDPFFDQNFKVDINGVNDNVNQGYSAPGYMMDPSMMNQQFWGFN